MLAQVLKSLRQQLHTTRKRLIALLLIGSLPIIALAYAIYGLGIPSGDLTRDPNVLAELPAYTGIASQLGLFLWAASLAIVFLTSFELERRSGNMGRRAFLLASAALTLLLLVDDAFLLHEEMLPGLGVPERATYLGYLSVVGLYLMVFIRSILQSEYLILLLSLGFFGLSVGIDVFVFGTSLVFFLEDSTKLLGICCWFYYHWRVCRSFLNRSTAGENKPAAHS
ncbi:hypothetical protein [Coraliomargarita akajimensis]|uniref:Uncharacterized protein n=1 Tax=Coraliomargarita akajimensis (strain DSM 45221 / IAM 15411 / JCM 23193 / KCTC 12865 / 04OKA010-24) TaxID=583355 RepID=D5EQP4_CORAD|nr:hypothetical protein [Coraliomargarita akajimensis]ADE55858.1 conserved hypothetical protein [Coraliomargarita akajimensis DSM 45221]